MALDKILQLRSFVDVGQCRALFESGAGSSYISLDLIKHIKMNPSKREFKRIEMLMHTATKQREIYEAGLTDLHEKFKMIGEFNNMDNNILL